MNPPDQAALYAVCVCVCVGAAFYLPLADLRIARFDIPKRFLNRFLR